MILRHGYYEMIIVFRAIDGDGFLAAHINAVGIVVKVAPKFTGLPDKFLFCLFDDRVGGFLSIFADIGYYFYCSFLHVVSSV